jgi:hypothetical protein
MKTDTTQTQYEEFRAKADIFSVQLKTLKLISNVKLKTFPYTTPIQLAYHLRHLHYIKPRTQDPKFMSLLSKFIEKKGNPKGRGTQ